MCYIIWGEYMVLPNKLQEKINELFALMGKHKLANSRSKLTENYKTKSGQGKSLIETKEDSLVYAISRMPATYAVNFSLLSGLVSQGIIKDVNSIIEIGSGTGAGYFAAKSIFENSLWRKDYSLAQTEQTISEEITRQIF